MMEKAKIRIDRDTSMSKQEHRYVPDLRLKKSDCALGETTLLRTGVPSVVDAVPLATLCLNLN
jgi:hypothetical protein